MNRGSTYRERSQHQPAFQAYSVRRAPGSNARGERVQEPSVGITAKDTGKPKHLLKMSSKDLNVLSPIRPKIPEERTDGQKTLPNTRALDKGKPPPKNLNHPTKKSDRNVSFAATSTAEVRSKTSKDESTAKKNAELEEEESRLNGNAEEKLRAKITGAVINYIKSTPFKRQLSEHIVWEISVKIAKAVSQYHEQQQAKKVCKAKTGAQHKNPTRRCQRERSSKLGFSISVASLLGYELIESRDKMIEYFKSKSSELSTANNAETEIVKNVFESILAFVINVETLHPVEDFDAYSSDCTMDSFESILQNINSADSESPFHEPTLNSDDESSTSSALFTAAGKSDAEEPVANEVVPSRVDALKVEDLGQQEHQEPQERTISGPRKFMEKLKSFLTPAVSDQDQSSEVDVKEKDDAENEVEEEKMQADVIPATQDEVTQADVIPTTQTTAIEQEQKNLDKDLGFVVEQVTTSEENIRSVDERDIRPSERQELSSPFPSPPASEKPDSPRESPKRTTCPPQQISYSPDLPVFISETSDTETTTSIPKEEDDLRRTPALKDTEMAVSLRSEEKEEEMEMLDSDQQAEKQLVDEPEVILDQVLATPSEDNVPCESTEQDVEPIRHEECASPVPSPASTEEPASPRKSATRSTRSSRKVNSLYRTKKAIRKGSVATSSRLKEPQMLSKTFEMKKRTVHKAAPTSSGNERRPSTASDASAQSLKAPKTEPNDFDLKTTALPGNPDVTQAKSSERAEEQIYFFSTIHGKKNAPVKKKRIDFSKCCTSCTCDQEQDN